MNNKDRYLLFILASFFIFLTTVITKSSAEASEIKTEAVTERYYQITTDIVNDESEENTTVSYTTEKHSEVITNEKSETTTEAADVNVSAVLSKQELLLKLTDSVNKTKLFKGDISVRHIEKIDIKINSCTGGSVVKSALNNILSEIIEPTDEILVFSNGKATNSANETVSLLLPQQKDFSLNMDGIRYITSVADSDKTVVKIKLVSETVDLFKVPQHNAACIGYLDASLLDLSFIDITRAEIEYSGSEIEIHITDDGYVSYAEYKMPVNVDGSAKIGIINGSADISGVYTEIWELD